MKIIIENIGAIKYAEFTLADLTIICGKNHSGKSTIVYAFYGFLDYFRNRYHMKASSEVVQNLLENRTVQIKLDCSLSGLSKYVRYVCKHYVEYLHTVFAARKEQFANSSFNIELEESDLSVVKEYKCRYPIGKSTILEIVKEKDSNELTISISQNASENEEVSSLKSALQKVIGEAVKDVLFGNIFPECFIATAVRTGVVFFNEELNLESNKNFRLNEKAHTPKPSYALPIEREITFIKNLESISNEQSELSKLHPDIMAKFSEIVGGEYRITSVGLKYIPHAQTKRKSLEHTLSEGGNGVRSLLEVYFYLKYIGVFRNSE